MGSQDFLLNSVLKSDSQQMTSYLVFPQKCKLKQKYFPPPPPRKEKRKRLINFGESMEKLVLPNTADVSVN